MEIAKKRKVWGVRCEVPSCRTTRKNSPYISFFNFPTKGSDLFEKWLQAIGLTCAPKPKKPYICSKHFPQVCIGKKKLKKNAIPSLRLGENSDNSFPLTQVPCTSNYNSIYDSDPDHIPVLFFGKSYKRPICDELKLEDLPKYEPEPTQNTEEIDENPCCANCLKAEKNSKYYMNKNNILKNQNKILKAKLRQKSILCKSRLSVQKIKNLKLKKLKSLENVNKSLPILIDSVEDIDSPSKTFAKMLLCKKSKNKAWSDDAKMLAQNLHYKSPSAYQFMRKTLDFNLPAVSSIYRWLPIKNCSPGFNSDIKEYLSKIISKLSDEEKLVVLVFDEMAIRKELIYDSTKDEIIGYVDLGDVKNKNIAKHVCLFMVRGIFTNSKIIISYYSIDTAIKTETLEAKIKENINYCVDIGLNVKAIVCDQASNNRSVFKRLGVSCDKPYFEYNSQRIFATYDVPHLFKSIRNTIMKYNIVCEDGEVSWNVLKELYNLEQKKTTKMCTKITAKHVYPDTWQKMKVSYAVQVLSHTCSSAIKATHSLKQFSDEAMPNALPTAEFCEKMNNLFDMLNSKQPFNKNIYKSAIRKEGFIKLNLENMKRYLQTVVVKTSKKIYCFDGLLQAINCILYLSDDILKSYPDKEFLLTYKFNSDPAENLFSLIRFKGGNNKNPSLHDFNHIIGRILSNKIIMKSDFSNCEHDNEDFIIIEKNESNEEAEITKSEIVEPYSREVISSNDLEEPVLIHEDIILDYIDNRNSNDDSVIENASLRYFVGFLIKKFLVSNNCSLCVNEMKRSDEIINLESESERFIFFKNYSKSSDFGSLNAPTEYFFELCVLHVKIFDKISTTSCEIKGIKKLIITECLEATRRIQKFSSWFSNDNSCYEHHYKVLDYMLTVLLRKNCQWWTEKMNATKEYKAKRKLAILQNK